MSEVAPFEPPEVTNKEIRWASRLLGLPEYAFHGEDGKDPRQDVLRCMDSIDVAACPGSGKTTLLVAKLAILAEKWQHRTRGMCVLSHTNAARNEIETGLGNTSAGRRLLSYPHYIGTIHGFVNEFLALPWLRAKGYPIKIVDDDAVEKQRRWLLQNSSQFLGLRKHVDNSEQYQNLVAQWTVSSPDFCVGKTNGQPAFTNPGPSRKQLEALAKKVVSMGYHRYGEMFMWAENLMDSATNAVGCVRDRFPLLFIDEAQDNSEEQSRILHRIFIGGNAPVIRQRFGDSNQAIFNFVGDEEASTDKFPEGAVKKDIPNSHRFGQRIADLADPLGIDPYGLKGHEPKKPLASGEVEARHTVFLFDDNSAGKVLNAYAKLLIDTFSEQELREGTFTAVAQVHKDKGDDHRPRHVGHYWPGYDPELATREPKPATFVQYVLAGMRDAERIGEVFPAVTKIAEGVLWLSGMAEDGRTFLLPRHRHQYVLQALEENTQMRNSYRNVVDRFAVRREGPTKDMWNDRRRCVVRNIAETIAGAPLVSAEIDEFLAWNDEPDASTLPSSARTRRDNVYRFSADGKDVSIRIGSVHSVKGETHRATLVLETFWHDHNLNKLKKWITGSRKGWMSSDGVQQRDRLKVHYVALTRPTHLLCLAMKRGSFETEPGTLDDFMIEALTQHGWQIQILCQDKSSESKHYDS